MPPQGYLVLGGLGWNYIASRLGKPTISMWARRHKVIAVAVWCGATVWVIPHWWRDTIAVLEALDDRIDPSNLPEETL